MNRRKIINDPIYGLISFPFELLYDIIDHPSFQRLRRISQMGLSTYVYPGATHSRFSHALGALHLMTIAIQTLRSKGHDISDEEYLGACVAILLHDIGHGPFSHALEGIIIEDSHENISLQLMQVINNELNGQLSTGISIFKGQYHKKFLTQLVSSQLDVDRMDYLTRDSYFSGVAEGVIGYKRILSMLNVVDNQLVVEEKGIFSIEKFLVSRHIMYWQVYLHKTSIVAEQMLKSYLIRLKELVNSNKIGFNQSVLLTLLRSKLSDKANILSSFIKLDDVDVYHNLKIAGNFADPILELLSKGILNRQLFKVILQKASFEEDFVNNIHSELQNKFGFNDELIEKLILTGSEKSRAYNTDYQEINILKKNGSVKPISDFLDILVNVNEITKHYMCFPKIN
ncbi:MAG: HD domain-containing protein [Saprospiraceae bacterium]|nr:HD domain-containing protein [Bacteroidia bacterium]NNE16344.1 HD domain-containing protein [Saprospiraceae bacterium]NNL91036.1 HD domain-containing protein [Saprospiraceae bacterium]